MRPRPHGPPEPPPLEPVRSPLHGGAHQQEERRRALSQPDRPPGAHSGHQPRDRRGPLVSDWHPGRRHRAGRPGDPRGPHRRDAADLGPHPEVPGSGALGVRRQGRRGSEEDRHAAPGREVRGILQAPGRARLAAWSRARQAGPRGRAGQVLRDGLQPTEKSKCGSLLFPGDLQSPTQHGRGTAGLCAGVRPGAGGAAASPCSGSAADSSGVARGAERRGHGRVGALGCLPAAARPRHRRARRGDTARPPGGPRQKVTAAHSRGGLADWALGAGIFCSTPPTNRQGF
mmetsp:Transcript_4715/g.9680  ORF Transcript_4715/g.9680 Transcript_4715/m.9680 type:complete len:287 (+) Transcript_4715:1534-2394(+)